MQDPPKKGCGTRRLDDACEQEDLDALREILPEAEDVLGDTSEYLLDIVKKRDQLEAVGELNAAVLESPG